MGDSQASILFSPGGSAWLPDSTYHLPVKIENPMTMRNSFQILSLTAGNQNTGTWLLTDPAKMKIIPGIGLPYRKYVTHKAPGNQQTECGRWTGKPPPPVRARWFFTHPSFPPNAGQFFESFV